MRCVEIAIRRPARRQATVTKAATRRHATGTTIMKDNILLVDDDAGTIQLLGRILADSGYLRFATSGEDALRLARESAPDLMLLDAEMPGMSGFEVCEMLKADPKLADVPVIFVTSHSEAAFEVAGFEIGAADFIAKPVSAPLVLARVKTQLRMKRMADELRRIAAVDVLTGIPNRRSFEETLEREWRSARRAGTPLALLMIDVDHFKAFNDRYGHPAGDACLRSVANALVGASLRPSDFVARYGGEEFVVILPQTARGGAEHMAHRMLKAVEALAIGHELSSTARHITVSVGVAFYDDDSRCWTRASADSPFTDILRAQCSFIELVHAADKALYSAKHAGRAQARLLDIADVNAPQLAREITPSSMTPADTYCRDVRVTI
jgi:diguanylate cyclase (GGDEF)-like protein